MWLALVTLEALIRSHLGDAELKTCLTASGGTEHFEQFKLTRSSGAISLQVTDLRGAFKVSNCINRQSMHWRGLDGVRDETLSVMFVYDSTRAQLGLEVLRDVPNASSAPELTLVAGEEGGTGFRDGPADRARFELPMSIAAKDGLLYVADRENQALRVVDVKRGEVRTQLVFPTWEQRKDYRTTALAHPSGMAFDPQGRLHILDALQGTIWRVDGQHVEPVFQGERSELDNTRSLVFDADGTVLVTDTSRIIRIDLATRKLTTVVDKLKHPEGIALDGKGHLYVAEFDTRHIREITLATGTSRKIGKGTGSLACDGSALFVADSNGTVSKIDLASGKTTVLARGLDHFTSGGLGEMPLGLTIADGNLYVVESGASVIRRITTTGEVTTIAGRAPAHTWRKITRATDGTLYATAGQALYRLDGPGKQTRIAGHPTAMGHGDGIRDKARFRGPFGLASLTTGSLIVGEVNGQIRRVDPKRGSVKTIADFGIIINGVTTDAHDNVYVGYINAIERIAPNGKRTLITKDVRAPHALASDGDVLYVLDDIPVRGLESGVITVLRKLDLATHTSERLAVWRVPDTKSESSPISRGLVVRDGALWMTHGNRVVTRFDPVSRHERAILGSPSVTAADALAVAPDGLLVADGGAVLAIRTP